MSQEFHNHFLSSPHLHKHMLMHTHRLYKKVLTCITQRKTHKDPGLSLARVMS